LEEELKTYIYEYKWETGESSDITKAREVRLIDELNSFLGKYREEMELDSSIYKRLPNAKVFWTVNKKHYPNLSVIALRVLNIAVSTASCERAFSVESFIRNKHRNRLSTEKTSKLMIVKENIKILPFTADGEAVKNFYKTFTEEEED
jgi:hypothetical protein